MRVRALGPDLRDTPLKGEQLLEHFIGSVRHDKYRHLDVADVNKINHASGYIHGQHGSQRDIPVVLQIARRQND
ncbi:hypothetical protein D3C73_1583490 [compost metagenome]